MTVSPFTLVVFLELEESIQRAPMIPLMENATCQRQSSNYREGGVGQTVNERAFRIGAIEERLAFTTGKLNFFNGFSL